MEFFEGFIPDVRENMLKSALYVVNECVYDDIINIKKKIWICSLKIEQRRL